jgi:hypothetical protein
MTNLATLADRYADIKAEIDGLERLLKDLRKEIMATGREEIVGTRAIVSVGLSERTSLDTAAIKELLTDEQIASCSKTALIETVRVKPVKPAIMA